MGMGCIAVLAVYAALLTYSITSGIGERLRADEFFVRLHDSDLALLAKAEEDMKLISNTLQPSSEAPMPEDVHENFSPTPLPGGYIKPEVNDPNSRHTIAPSDNKSDNTKAVVIAVVVTAAITLSLAAFCFCCFYRYLRKKYRFDSGQRDDRPLLSLSLNDFSVSSNVAFGRASSFHNDKIGAFPSKVDPNRNGQAVSFGIPVDSQVDASRFVISGSAEPTNAPNHAIEPLHPPPLAVKDYPGTMVSSPPANPKPPLPPKGGTPPELRPPFPKATSTPLKDGLQPLQDDPPPPKVALPLPKMAPPLLQTASTPPKPPLPKTDPVLPKTDPPLPIVVPPLSKVAPPPPKTAPPPPKVAPSPPKTAPPPPKVAPSPPKTAPPPPKIAPPPPRGPLRPPQASSSSTAAPLPPSHPSTKPFDSDDIKTKLKPFFWDKVMPNPDQSVVWHQIKSGSFQFNEEMIETLFGYNATDKRGNDARKDFINDASSHRIRILDPKKSQNLAISLKAWNVKVEEVRDALMEGNELPFELLQALVRMAPTSDEEQKLRLFNDNTALLGPAEQFLKTIVNIPFAFKRMDALLLMTTLQEESTFVKESLATLEQACKDLRNNRLFLKLLEAVLKTGNRMNDGTFRGRAQAFKLDTLLKLSDVKGADGKTTLLHFVVQEIILSEGRRAARITRENNSDLSFNYDGVARDLPEQSDDWHSALGLEVVSRLSGELENVKKAAGVDADALAGIVVGLDRRLVKTTEFLNADLRNLKEESGFRYSLEAFVDRAGDDIGFLREEDERVRLLVKSTTDYFHGGGGGDEGLRLFVVVRDFMVMVDRVCREVGEARKKTIKMPVSMDSAALQSFWETRRQLFPAIKDRLVEGFSSDDERS